MQPFRVRYLASAAVALLWVQAPPAWPTSYALPDQGGGGMGTAYAGEAARAEDAATVFFNPAGMTRLEGRQAAVAVNVVRAKSDFRGTGVYNPDNPLIAAAGLGGVPYARGTGNDGTDEVGLVPTIYFVQPLGERVHFGVGLNAPFGLVTDFGNSWAGRYHADHSALRTIFFTPSLAWHATETLSFGFGISLVWGDAELTNAVDGGLGLAAAGIPAVPGDRATDLQFEYSGDDVTWAWNAGLLWAPQPETRLGLTWRPNVELDLDGDVDFDLPPALQAVFPPAGLAIDTDGKATADLPTQVGLGLYHDLNARWSLLAGATWTRWSEVDGIRIRSGNPLQPAFVEDLDYDDAWFVAVGATYRLSETLRLRAGVYFDESPTPNDRIRSARIPEEDSLRFTIGVNWQMSPRRELSVALGHLVLLDPDMDAPNGYVEPDTTGTHRLQGDFDGRGDFLAVSLHWRL